MIKDQKAAMLVIEYILENELPEYIQYCEENDLDPCEKNHTEHVYGAAREALGLEPFTI